jgi:endonuclease-3
VNAKKAKLVDRAKAVHISLLDFFGSSDWINPLPPLDELISTILSQNTNDVNRDVAFHALKKAYTSWEALRDAPEEEVIDFIRPAGLANQKGPRIQSVLKQITKLRGELSIDFLADLSPDEARQWLLQFKGVGPKTAAIVLQYSLGLPAFAVDTHVYRIMGRLGIKPEAMNADKAHVFLEELFPTDSYFAAHINLIRLGREICHARKPNCPACPLRRDCDYYAEHYDAQGRLLDEA